MQEVTINHLNLPPEGPAAPVSDEVAPVDGENTPVTRFTQPLPKTRTSVIFTPDGEVYVVEKDGEARTLIPDFPPSGPLPESWSARDHEVVRIVYGCSAQIKRTKNRHVPLTRAEALKQGISKKELRRAEKVGLIKERTIDLLDEKGRPMRAMAVVYLTPEGRSYVAEKINPDYRKELTDAPPAVPPVRRRNRVFAQKNSK